MQYDVASRGLEPRHHDLHPCALPVELRSQALREQESNLRCRGPKPRRPCQQTIPECVRAGGFEPPTGSVSENCSHQTELHARALRNVDRVGVEPTTSPVQGERATRCATSPRPRRRRRPGVLPTASEWRGSNPFPQFGRLVCSRKHFTRATPTGIEPATLRSTGGCSTTELRSQDCGACPRQESNLHSAA